VSILFLLLRLVTAPTPALPAATVAAKPAATLAETQAHLARIEAGPARIRTLMRSAQDSQFHAGCVAQRLAEAQVHVTLARDEIRRFEGSASGSADKAHAAKRLALIAERTAEVEHTARTCIEDELSTISATKFEIEVSPVVEAAGDVTKAEPPPLLPDLRPPKP
jgi:hypothetical protein